MEKNIFWAFIVASIVNLAACGGGGGGSDPITGTTFSGNTSAATISADNSDELAIAAASGAKQALSADSSNAPLRPSANSAALDSIMESFLSKVAKVMNVNKDQRLAQRTEDMSSYICTAGGSATATYPDNASTSNYNWSAYFSNCTYSSVGATAVYNGTMYGSYTVSGNITTTTFSYSNFTVELTYSGNTETYTLNYSATCTENTATMVTDCDVHSDFTGFDDRTYRVSDVSVSGDNSSGFDIDATVYDPDYGYFTITASNVTFCSSGFPGTGSVTYTDGSSSVTVDFLSCTEYQYTYDGTTYGPLTW